jgi:DegV family protein with EDD domain
MEKIAIVTDSTADIPEELARRHNIFTIPIMIIVDGESMEDGSGGEGNVPRLSREDFYKNLPEFKTFPTTAAPAIGTFQKNYERILDQGYQRIISIHLAKELSGTVDMAVMAAQKFEDRVQVIDSRQVSLGMGYQVLAAAEVIEGLEKSPAEASSAEVVQRLQKKMESTRNHLRLIGMLDTLEYLKRSGRVNWVQAAFGSLLNVKLMIEVQDGRVAKLGQARTRRAGLERLTSTIIEMGRLEKVAVIHTGCGIEKEVHQALDDLVSTLNPKPVSQMEVWITPVIGVHVGVNLIGFTAVACD